MNKKQKEYSKLRKFAIKELEEWLKFIINLDKQYYGTKTKKSKKVI